MNKTTKTTLAVIGGVDAALSIFTPIILAALWVIVNGLNDWTSYFFYGIGLVSTLFRAIKIGWLR